MTSSISTWFKPGHDLVAEQHLRLHRQRLGQLQAFAVRAAEFIGPLVDDLAQTHELETFARLFARHGQFWLAAAAPEQRADGHVIQHRHDGKRPHDLESAAYAQPGAAERWQVIDGFALEKYLS